MGQRSLKRTRRCLIRFWQVSKTWQTFWILNRAIFFAAETGQALAGAPDEMRVVVFKVVQNTVEVEDLTKTKRWRREGWSWRRITLGGGRWPISIEKQH
jgi:hypothetical protein